jgi:hypothetical protein
MSSNAWALTAAWRRVVVLVALALGSMVLPALAEQGDDWSSTPYRLLPDSSLRGPPDEYVIGGDDELTHVTIWRRKLPIARTTSAVACCRDRADHR